MRPMPRLAGLLRDAKMMIELKHRKTADRLSKLVGQFEGEREALAEALTHGTAGTRDLLLCELANLAHELEMAFRALRPQLR